MNKNIFFAIDDNYAMHAFVSITSLLINNNDSNLHIFILTKGLSEHNVFLLEKLKNKFPKTTIDLILLDENLLKNGITTKRFPISALFRLSIPNITNLDKALYIDSDTIINGKIVELYNTDLTDKSLGMVIDQYCNLPSLHGKIQIYTDYYNSGVLLFNLKYWRENKITEKILDYMTTYPERCIYPDQDAINAVLSDSIIRLDCKYNVQEGWYYQKNKYNCIKNKFWNEIDLAKYNPTIIHYTGKYKPWENLCTHPLKNLYNFYKNILLDE